MSNFCQDCEWYDQDPTEQERDEGLGTCNVLPGQILSIAEWNRCEKFKPKEETNASPT